MTAQGQTCAMVCPSGMEVGADTAGHCCWPTQVWSGSRQACVGIPTCPGGFQAKGENCVAQSQGSAAAPPPPPTQQAPPPPPPTVGTDAPTPVALTAAPVALVPVEVDGVMVPPGHHLERKMRKGLLIPGITLLGAGWLVSLLVAIGGGVYTVFQPSNTCWGFAASVAWVPLVGAPIAIGGQSNPSLRTDGGKQCMADNLYPIGLVLAVFDTILQWTGLTLMVLGIAVKTTEVVPDQVAASPPSQPELFLSLGSRGSPLGLTVGLRGW